MDKKLMNKMDDMELDKVSGGARGNRGNDVKKGTFSSLHGSMQNENANSMAANVDVDETQKASGWLGSRLVNSDIV